MACGCMEACAAEVASKQEAGGRLQTEKECEVCSVYNIEVTSFACRNRNNHVHIGLSLQRAAPHMICECAMIGWQTRSTPV